MASWRWLILVPLASCLSPWTAQGQIDPVKRELFQFGYNAPFQGHPPLSAYAFFYRNEPDFLSNSNLTLRLALAPTYLDSELGVRGALGAHTDVGFGLAGGGFADSYYEIRQGKYLPQESFDGFGAEVNSSVYHLFNPDSQIPLYAVVRGGARYATYDRGSQTDPSFRVPPDEGIFSVRSGLRWGGREPTLFPALAMELSIWEQSDFRTTAATYGYGDRQLEPASHLFWAEALLDYTFPNCHHSFYVSVIGGSSINADRFTAYRLGALLPMSSEFPLSLPGYYYQEISAEQFLLFGGTYIVPIDRRQRWNVSATASTAVVDYLPGFEQPGNWHSGVGGGLFYKSETWRVMIGYGYGIDAIRSSGRGAHSIGLLVQFDLTRARQAFFRPEPASHWRGFQRILGVLGD